MYDIKQLKHMILHGGVALSEPLEKRILNDEMTEEDHAFISKSFGAMRDIKKNGLTVNGKKISLEEWLLKEDEGK